MHEAVTTTDDRRDAPPAGTAPAHPEEERAPSIRQLLLTLVMLGALGLASELLLLDHTESVWQWMPLAVLGAGIAAGGFLALRPNRGTVRAFQLAMALLIATGLLGIYLHYDGNAAFEREMDASARGFALLWRALRGATPALAPGALAQLGLVGLVVTYRHPALSRRLPSR